MSYKIIGKYIKSLKFEIPNAKTFFLLGEDISNYKINVDIKSNQIKEKIVEIDTTLALIPVKDNFEKINVSIVYSAIIELDIKIEEKKKLEKIILIEVPTVIYGNVREIFVNVFEQSGFKDIKIDKKVDFEKLYNLRKS